MVHTSSISDMYSLCIGVGCFYYVWLQFCSKSKNYMRCRYDCAMNMNTCNTHSHAYMSTKTSCRSCWLSYSFDNNKTQRNATGWLDFVSVRSRSCACLYAVVAARCGSSCILCHCRRRRRRNPEHTNLYFSSSMGRLGGTFLNIRLGCILMRPHSACMHQSICGKRQLVNSGECKHECKYDLFTNISSIILYDEYDTCEHVHTIHNYLNRTDECLFLILIWSYIHYVYFVHTNPCTVFHSLSTNGILLLLSRWIFRTTD